MSRLDIVTLCFNCDKRAAIDRHREYGVEDLKSMDINKTKPFALIFCFVASQELLLHEIQISLTDHAQILR